MFSLIGARWRLTQRFQIADQVRRSLISIVSLLLQGLINNLGERFGCGRIVSGQRDRLTLDHGGHDINRGVADKGSPAADHLVKNYAQTPEVAARIEG